MSDPFKIFLSYSHKDGAIVEKLYKAIASRGHNVFWDQDIPSGTGWEPAVNQELESAFAVIAVWSKSSVQSAPVLREAEWAREKKLLCHVVIDPSVKPPNEFLPFQATDLSYWDGTPNDSKIDKVLQFINDIADYTRGSKQRFTVKRPLQLIRSEH